MRSLDATPITQRTLSRFDEAIVSYTLLTGMTSDFG